MKDLLVIIGIVLGVVAIMTLTAKIWDKSDNQ